MSAATNQAVQHLILAYLEEHPDFLETIKQQFIAPPDNARIPVVDAETERQVGEALKNFRHGKYVVVDPDEDILYALNNFGKQLQQQNNVPA